MDLGWSDAKIFALSELLVCPFRFSLQGLRYKDVTKDATRTSFDTLLLWAAEALNSIENRRMKSYRLVQQPASCLTHAYPNPLIGIQTSLAISWHVTCSLRWDTKNISTPVTVLPWLFRKYKKCSSSLTSHRPCWIEVMPCVIVVYDILRYVFWTIETQSNAPRYNYR